MRGDAAATRYAWRCAAAACRLRGSRARGPSGLLDSHGCWQATVLAWQAPAAQALWAQLAAMHACGTTRLAARPPQHAMAPSRASKMGALQFTRCTKKHQASKGAPAASLATPARNRSQGVPQAADPLAGLVLTESACCRAPKSKGPPPPGNCMIAGASRLAPAQLGRSTRGKVLSQCELCIRYCDGGRCAIHDAQQLSAAAHTSRLLGARTQGRRRARSRMHAGLARAAAAAVRKHLSPTQLSITAGARPEPDGQGPVNG